MYKDLLRKRRWFIDTSVLTIPKLTDLNRFEGVFLHAEHLNNLEISIHRKLKLTYKYFFEWADVCLLVKYQHGLFVFNGINGSK